MLVLTRKVGETIVIGNNIEVTVIKSEDGNVRLAINAPKNISIVRKELFKQISEENKCASKFDKSVLENIKK